MHRNRLLPALLAVLCTAGCLTLSAQVSEDASGKRRKEIVIRSDEKGGKTVIEIDGERVMVDGKEVPGAEKETFIMKRSSPEGRTFIFRGDSLKMPESFLLHEGMPDIRVFRNEGAREWNRTESRTQLGVRLQDHAKGVEVVEVAETGGAEKAGVRIGDIITAVDGKAMSQPRDMVDYIQSKKPGEVVRLEILRDEKPRTLEATLGEMRVVSRFRTLEAPFAPEMRGSLDGIAGQGRNRVIIREPALEKPGVGLSVEETGAGNGLRILEVAPGSPAEKAGVRKGDILKRIGDHDLKDVYDLQKVLTGEVKDFDMTLERSGNRMEVKIAFPKTPRRADF